MSSNKEQIAIIGVSGRFPGASNIYEFWQNLSQGIESVSFFSEQELIDSGIDKELIKNSNYIKARGILGNAEYFDPQFFGFSPREAEIIDPQQRVFLECAWEALEDAGYNPQVKNYKIGVFGGAGTPWNLVNLANNSVLSSYTNEVSLVTSNDRDYLTTRVSYELGLEGPSVNIQSACSTSLVAIILGAFSILNGQSDIVLAGGVSIKTPEKYGYLYQPGSLNSIDGHCKTFDIDASGTVFSHGAGVVVLKKLSDAIRDRDNIYAVIKGMAINNDGNKKVGFTAPSTDGHMQVELEAFKMAQIHPEHISFVEAHGTATKLGDPIEIEGLTRAFRKYTDKKQFCPIGSVKTNIGHTDTASGVASLIKILLSIKHRVIPKTLNFNQPNPEIDFLNSPFYVQTETENLKNKSFPFSALINSFGIGGTNACMIVQEPPTIINSSLSVNTKKLFVLSAKTESALNSMTNNLSEFLKNNNTVNIEDVSYTLQTGRSLFKHRRFFVAKNIQELLKAIEHKDGYSYSTSFENNQPATAFMFPGQGTQYINMGKWLYNNNEIFRKYVNECSIILSKKFNINIEQVLYSNLKTDFDDTVTAQITLFVTEYALAKLLIFYGIIPNIMIGHSIGEYSAACIAGVFSLEDVLNVIIKRAQLVEELAEEGSMLAVLLPEDKVLSIIGQDLDIGAVNSPDSVIVSGSRNNILKLQTDLKKQNIPCKLLATRYGFHSVSMSRVVEPLYDVLSKITLSPPSIPFISTVTGDFISSKQVIDPNYWAIHLRKTVLFSQAASKLVTEYKNGIFLEVGPGNSLESAIRKQLDTQGAILGTTMQSEKTAEKDFFYSIGKAWAAGVNINWNNYYTKQERFKVSLPTYPFDRERFIFEGKNESLTKIKNKKTDNWFYIPFWRRTIPVNPTSKEADFIWVIFSDSPHYYELLQKKLQQHNSRVIIVEISNEFIDTKSSLFGINPKDKTHYQMLFTRIKETVNAPLSILNLFNLDKKLVLSHENIAEYTDNIFNSLLFMQQALIEENMLDGLSFTIATHGVFDVIGKEYGEAYSPEQALAIGPCKVFSREYHMVKSRIIDFNNDLAHSNEWVDFLISEVISKSDEEIVSYRGGYRWIRDFEQLSFKPEHSNILQSRGVYIITGALGGIGQELSKYLFYNFKAQLVLIYYSSLPERDKWQDYITTYPSSDFTRQKIETILTLEKDGAEILLYSGNVCDYESMKTIVELTIQKFGKINGVFHTAGIPGNGIIPLKTVEEARKVFDPKVAGTVVLNEVTKDINLDIFVLFSSVTALLGEAGQIDYCSANAFLNAFAEYRKHRYHGKTISINWGKWSSIGMAVKYELSKLETNNQNAILPIVDNTTEVIYYIDMLPDQDWVISDHKLLGFPTLVGTAYINILFKLFGNVLPDRFIILENLLFLSPLIFLENNKKVLKFSKNNSDFIFTHYDSFTFSTQKESQLLKGQIEFIEKTTRERVDINSIIKNMHPSVLDPQDWTIFKWNSITMLEFSARWRSTKSLYTGNNEWLAFLQLPKNFYDDLSNFPLHPAMIDVATAFCVKCITNEFYLPFYYRKITILTQELPTSIYSYAKMKESPQGEVIILDILITDKEGNPVIDIEGFTLKKVTKEIIASFQKQLTIMEKDSVNPFDIQPKEGIDAFNRAIGLDTTELAIYPGDLDVLIAEAISEQDNSKPKLVMHQRGNISTEYIAPSNKIEEALAEIWQSTLGINKVGILDNFIELGGNSLIAIQIVSSINGFFKNDYTVNKFYNDLTIESTGKRIVEELAQSVEKYDLSSLLINEAEQ